MAEEWAKIALGYWDHPKIARAGGAVAGEAHQRMIFYCKKHPGTLGVVPFLASPVLAASKKTIRGLEREGLIVREPEGWRVRDVEVWQNLGEPEPAIPAGTSPEAARARAEDAARARSISEVRREAGRSGGLRSAEARSKQNQANGQANDPDPASKRASKPEANGQANVARASGSSGSVSTIGLKIQEPRDAREGQANSPSGHQDPDDCEGWGIYRSGVSAGARMEPWRCAEAAFASWHRRTKGETWKARGDTVLRAMRDLADATKEAARNEAKPEAEIISRALANFEKDPRAAAIKHPPTMLVTRWHFYLNPPDRPGMAPVSRPEDFQPGTGLDGLDMIHGEADVG